MLLVIMTRSLIRLGNTVRASLNTGLNDKVHDETRVKADVRTNVDDDDGITNSYSGYNKSYGGITRSYRIERERVGTNTNNDDITRGYN